MREYPAVAQLDELSTKEECGWMLKHDLEPVAKLKPPGYRRPIK